MSVAIWLALVTIVGMAGCGGRAEHSASSTEGTANGGHRATGGAPSTGGAATTGGTAAGGTSTNAGDTGTGCTGSYESIEDVKGHPLCVGTMVTVTAPAGSSNYRIDATEVTRGQYESWVGTNPSSSDTACGWKSTSSFLANSICMASSSVCQGSGCDHHPVVCVDWYDASCYCAAVGKRLCGRMGGGSDEDLGSSDASASQWLWACTSGGADAYPYGDTYETTYCNGYDYWGDDEGTTFPVAMLSTCQSRASGYTGVYDLSGNVWEWEDSCYDTVALKNGIVTDGPPACYLRGGAFDSYGTSSYTGAFSVGLECSDANADGRDYSSPDVGFRCCSP
jgi:formylglycine-generating enzyme